MGSSPKTRQRPNIRLLAGGLIGAVVWLGFVAHLLLANPVVMAQGISLISRIWLGGGACMMQTGSGTPEGAVTGNVCDFYLRTNGSTGTTLYIKESGTGNTGWAAKATGGDASTNTSTSVVSEIALFADTSGKLLKRATGTGFAKVTSGVLSAVASIVEGDFGFTDIATANASTSAHGLLRKLDNLATHVLDGTGAWVAVTEAMFGFTDITTGNATTSAHGLVPKGDNVASDCLSGQITWVACGSGGGGGTGLTREEGRLTTESNVPVSTSDRTSQGTIYWTPTDRTLQSLTHGTISLYNAASIVDVDVTQLSLALTATSGKNYDVFVDYNSGTPQLVLSAAWTNDTTRADALGVQYDATRKVSIIIKSGTAAYRWVGTIRASGSNVTEDSAQNRYVANVYNLALRKLFIQFPSTYAGTASWRETNGSTSYRLNVVIPSAERVVDVSSRHFAVWSSGGASEAATAIAMDSTSTPDSDSSLARANLPVGYFLPSQADLIKVPGIGFHYFTKLERSGTGVEWRGVDAGYGNTGALSGKIWN